MKCNKKVYIIKSVKKFCIGITCRSTLHQQERMHIIKKLWQCRTIFPNALMEKTLAEIISQWIITPSWFMCALSLPNYVVCIMSRGAFVVSLAEKSFSLLKANAKEKLRCTILYDGLTFIGEVCVSRKVVWSNISNLHISKGYKFRVRVTAMVEARVLRMMRWW